MVAGIVVVGAGECGAAAALTLREAGYSGPLTLIGGERHPPYERPPLSKGVLTASDEPEPRTIAPRDRLAARAIDWLNGNPAIAIDRDAKLVRLADGASLAYDRLMLATGAAPRRLPGAPAGAVYLRTYDDALHIRSRLRQGCRVGIIGAGFIGLEVAAAARQRGCAVSVLEAQPRILMRGVPEPIASVVAARHAAEGVQISCGVGISRIEAGASGACIVMADGARLEVDLCIIGVGAAPVTDLAAAAGLAIDNGVVVDEFLRTSDPDIYAGGDCCSFPLAIHEGRRVRLESWRNAQEQGAVAARNLLGADEAHKAVPWFWSDQYDLTLYVAGLPGASAAATIRRDIGEGGFLLFQLAEDGRLIAASGLGVGGAAARDIRLAEMLIAKRVRPAPEALAAPDVRLKTLLAA